VATAPATGVLSPFVVRSRPIAAVLVALATVCGCRSNPSILPVAASPSGFAQQLEQFPRAVTEVAPGVHVATGYGLANSVLIVGAGGSIVVDAMESAEAAAPVRDQFRRIAGGPPAAIVYTHNHADHIMGAQVFADGGTPEILAHATFAQEFGRIAAVTRDVTYRRAMRQFGVLLPDGDRVHCGVGPKLEVGAGTTQAPLLPTRTFDGDRLETTIAGIRLVLLHLPGETPDQIAVWLPDRRVLVSGDNYYHSFPNLYAIRGTPVRDVTKWVASIDAMRALQPEVLLPGHTLPVRGAADIRERLTDYRDAIQFVHDQTVRQMNLGRSPDQIVSSVKLPPGLAGKPWLSERYGRVDWSVRGIFDAYLGWFGGDAAELSPLSPGDRARRLATLAGGSERLRDAALHASKAGDARWALELAGHLAALGEFTSVAARVRAESLRALAASETSANGRNWYLTEALEAEEAVTIETPDPASTSAELTRSIPVGDFLRAMTVRLDPEKAAGKTLRVGFRFPDLGEEWAMTLRNSVVELARGLPESPDMTVTADSLVWKEVLTRKRNATAAFAKGDVEVDRNRLELVRFLFLFR
jgi:alkyl sulfatase BDS1-like metallo-beta-lactamase superfamily hydrolase